jgi:glycosyltransferase involved in cell wall biosynthesis
MGGIETYVRNLIWQLARIDRENSYILFNNGYSHNTFGALPANFRSVSCPVPPALRAAQIAWEQVVLPIQVRKHSIDVLHSPNTVAPLFVRCPSVVTICDMLYRYYPDSISKSSLWYRSLAIPLSARRCEQILTISHFSERDIIRFLKVPEGKITVTPLACDRDQGYRGVSPSISEVRKKYAIQGRYILSVAGTEPHKNLRGLVEAFAKLCKQSREIEDVLLVIVGRRSRSVARVDAAIDELGLRKRVRTLGYVPAEHIPPLYAGARVFVNPSLFEGFGLPVLEAMANGVPVVSSNAAALPEIVGDSGILVDPTNPSEISQGIRCALIDEDCRRDMVKKGYRRVEHFSWQETARTTLQVYKKAACLDRAPYI